MFNVLKGCILEKNKLYSRWKSKHRPRPGIMNQVFVGAYQHTFFLRKNLQSNQLSGESMSLLK